MLARGEKQWNAEGREPDDARSAPWLPNARPARVFQSVIDVRCGAPVARQEPKLLPRRHGPAGIAHASPKCREESGFQPRIKGFSDRRLMSRSPLIHGCRV
jgi:hypothetical protein